MSRTTGSPTPPGTGAVTGHPSETEDWDEVSQASWESFPASDPPSWIGRSRHDPSDIDTTHSLSSGDPGDKS
jgi:hypothetical protein